MEASAALGAGASVGANQAARGQCVEAAYEMRLGVGPVRQLEPVLFGEGEQRGLVVLDFPQDSKQRGEILFLLADRRIDGDRGIGVCDTAAFGTGAETEVDNIAPCACELPMGDL